MLDRLSTRGSRTAGRGVETSLDAAWGRRRCPRVAGPVVQRLSSNRWTTGWASPQNFLPPGGPSTAGWARCPAVVGQRLDNGSKLPWRAGPGDRLVEALSGRLLTSCWGGLLTSCWTTCQQRVQQITVRNRIVKRLPPGARTWVPCSKFQHPHRSAMLAVNIIPFSLAPFAA